MEAGLWTVLEHLRRILAERAEPAGTAQRAAEVIRQAGGYRWVGLYVVGPKEIRVLGWSGPSAPTHPSFPIAHGLNGAAVASGEPVVVQYVTQDSRYLTTLSSTRAEMIVPVRGGPVGQVVGTVDVESDRVNAFTDRDRRLVGACAEALATLWAGAV
jgi:GAF domain-containing protein